MKITNLLINMIYANKLGSASCQDALSISSVTKAGETSVINRQQNSQYKSIHNFINDFMIAQVRRSRPPENNSDVTSLHGKLPIQILAPKSTDDKFLYHKRQRQGSYHIKYSYCLAINALTQRNQSNISPRTQHLLPARLAWNYFSWPSRLLIRPYIVNQYDIITWYW